MFFFFLELKRQCPYGSRFREKLEQKRVVVELRQLKETSYTDAWECEKARLSVLAL